ncbi:MAG: hypothetical protein ACKOWO_05885 [Sediminibacterium sp.]
MRKTILYTLFILSSLPYSAMAQSPNSSPTNSSEDEVKQVIQNMFRAMKQADTALLKTCFSDKVIFQTILNKPEGAVVNNQSVNDFLQSIGKQTANALDERIEFGSINIDPLMATVWTPYTFYYKGNYSHKGVNSFQLVKLKEGWKIQYIIDTRYK